MKQDRPIEAARQHFEDGQFVHGDFVYLTARMESTHDVTKAWLVEHGFARSDTRVICKPDRIRRQRSTVFKPTVLRRLQRTEFPDRPFVLIDDYADVRRATERAGFGVLRAPECWDQAWETDG